MSNDTATVTVAIIAACVFTACVVAMAAVILWMAARRRQNRRVRLLGEARREIGVTCRAVKEA